MAAYIKHLARNHDGSWTLRFGVASSDAFDDVLDEPTFRLPSDVLPDLDGAITGSISTWDRRQRPASLSTVPSAVQRTPSALHLLPSALRELISATRRILARTAHLDADGHHTEMKGINQAVDRPDQWEERQTLARTGGARW